MHRFRLRSPFAACFVLCLWAGTAAGADPSGAFLLCMGKDTLAIERFERAGGGTKATLLFRVAGTRATWRTVEGPGGAVVRMEAEFAMASDPPGSPPKQTATVVFSGDSVFTETTPGEC